MISDYGFDFYACDGSVKIFYFFLVQFWKDIFIRICPFLPSGPFYWHIVTDSDCSSDPLHFCVVCCDFSIFISNFVDLILLSLSLDESG